MSFFKQTFHFCVSDRFYRRNDSSINQEIISKLILKELFEINVFTGIIPGKTSQSEAHLTSCRTFNITETIPGWKKHLNQLFLKKLLQKCPEPLGISCFQLLKRHDFMSSVIVNGFFCVF